MAVKSFTMNPYYKRVHKMLPKIFLLLFEVQTVPKNTFNFNVDNIRVCKILGADVRSSSTMNGMVFRRGAEGEVKEVNNARIAVFACPFDLTQTETKVCLLRTFTSRRRNAEEKRLLQRELKTATLAR